MSNIIFLKNWYDELINDEFSPLSAEEMAYILYAAAMYSWEGVKTNFKDTFGRADLNRVMAPYYTQIDNILKYKSSSNNVAVGNQSYNNFAISDLASKGFTQKEICQILGYDESKSRSLSTNKGYREGRALYSALPPAAKQELKEKKVEIRQQYEKSEKSEVDSSELEKLEIERSDSQKKLEVVRNLTNLTDVKKSETSEISQNSQKFNKSDSKKSSDPSEIFNF